MAIKTCAICDSQIMSYEDYFICKICGQPICNECIDPNKNLCPDCLDELEDYDD